jgi:exodeoxyribonuclease V beta subunit
VAHALEESLGEWAGTLETLVAGSGGAMTHEILIDAGEESEAWSGSTITAAEPRCRDPLPRASQMETWRVSSFTSLTAGRHLEDARDLADHGAGEASEAPERVEARHDFMSFPRGRHAGVILHELFERLDFACDEEATRALASEILMRERVALHENDERIGATVAMASRVVRTVIPGADFALRDVPVARTLREWKFHLPLGAVDRRTFADLFSAHGGDVARRYASALRALAPERTHGFLTGVVDLAFERDGRWYVVDWKSNHLGAEPEQYEREGLEREMAASHYVLQYHLYVTALHRFLRARLPGYDYDSNMGGACYTFLRGVDGTERGWFVDRPARALVEALDALMGAPSMAATPPRGPAA